MNKRIRSAGALLIGLVLILSLMPTAFAAGTVKIGGTDYATLADAVSAAQDGDTIEVSSTQTIGDEQTTTGKNFTIRLLGGSTLDVSENITGSVKLDVDSYKTRKAVLTGDTDVIAASAEHFTMTNSKWVVSGRTGHLLTKNQAALERAAFAYYDARANIRYHQYSIAVSDVSGTRGRREYYSAPQFATKERTIFLDCSSYVWSVYRYAFGATVADGFAWDSTSTMESKTGTPESFLNTTVVYNWSNGGKAMTAEEHAQVVADMKAIIEPGDLIVRRNPSSGHTMIFIDSMTENGAMIEVGDTHLDLYAAIYSETENQLFNGYLKGATCVKLLRPLTDIEKANKPLTSNVQAMMKNGRLSIFKTSGNPDGQTVIPGSEITFTITLNNNPSTKVLSSRTYASSDTRGMKDVTVTVTEPLPTGVTFKTCSNGGTFDGSKIVFKDVNVPKGTKVELTYTATVNLDATKIVSGITKVDNFSLAYKDLQVGNSLTATQKDKLAAQIDAGKPDGQSALSWIADIYEAAIGKRFETTNSTTLFNQFFTNYPSTGTAKGKSVKLSTSASYANIIGSVVMHSVATDRNAPAVENLIFAGGAYLNTPKTSSYATRVRLLEDRYFQYGDILAVCEDGAKYTYYIYLDERDDSQKEGGHWLKVTDSGTQELISERDRLESAAAMNDRDMSKLYYEQIIGAWKAGTSSNVPNSAYTFVLLRPSLLNNTFVAEVNGKEYTSLSEAVEAAAKEPKVDNFVDVNIIGSVDFATPTTIKLDGQTRLTVKDGKSYTISGPVTFDGQNLDASCVLFYVDKASSLTLDGVTIKDYKNTQSLANHNNTIGMSRIDGASDIVLKNVTVANCSGKRGAFYATNEGTTFTAENCTFTGNMGTGDDNGAVLYLYSKAAATLDNCTVTGNTTPGSGVIATYGGANCTASLKNCTITGNSSTGSAASAIYYDCGATGALTLDGCTIKDNTGSDVQVYMGTRGGKLTLAGACDLTAVSAPQIRLDGVVTGSVSLYCTDYAAYAETPILVGDKLAESYLNFSTVADGYTVLADGTISSGDYNGGIYVDGVFSASNDLSKISQTAENVVVVGNCKLGSDAAVNNLVIRSEGSVDLNGKTLTVNGGLATVTPIANGTLRVKSGATVSLGDNGGFVPVFVGENGGYKNYELYGMSMKVGKASGETATGARFEFGYQYDEFAAYAKSVAANANNEFKIGAKLAWEGKNGMQLGGNFNFSTASVEKMNEVEDGAGKFYFVALRMTTNGLASIKAQPIIRVKSLGFTALGGEPFEIIPGAAH